MFADILPEKVIKVLDAHELKEDPSIGDLYYWNGSSRGKFTMKSAMQIMMRENVEQYDKRYIGPHLESQSTTRNHFSLVLYA